MANLNKVFLLGNLTRDIQIRYTPGGTAVAEMGMAVNRSWFDKQSQTKKEDVAFIDVTLWGRDAEVAAEYLSKGRSVFVEGRLHLDQFEDKKTGEKRSKLKVVCENMQFIGGNGERRSTGSSQQSLQQQSGEESQEIGELPPHGSPAPSDEVPFIPF